MDKNEIIKNVMDDGYIVKYDSDEVTKKYKKIPYDKICSLGIPFGVSLLSLKEIAKNNNISGTKEAYIPINLYGTGDLIDSKDGIGKLGGIFNEHGLVGQARWIKVDMNPSKVSLTVPLLTLACFAVLYVEIEKRNKIILSEIEKVYQYNVIKDDSQILANFDILKNIYNNYQYIVGNDVQMNINYERVVKVKDSSVSYIYMLEQLIANDQGKKVNDASRQRIEKNLEKFRFVVYCYTLASFLEIIFSKNFEHGFLENSLNNITEYCDRYREKRKELEVFLEKYKKKLNKSNVLSYFLPAVGYTADFINTINGNGLSNSNFGDNLSDFSYDIRRRNENKALEAEHRYLETQISDEEFFAKEIRKIDKLYNEEKMLMFDDEGLYICDDLM